MLNLEKILMQREHIMSARPSGVAGLLRYICIEGFEGIIRDGKISPLNI